MSDIVDRLRGPHGFQPECYTLRADAADEIERLRAALDAAIVLINCLRREMDGWPEDLEGAEGKFADALRLVQPE